MNWHGWQHTRTVYFYHGGPIVVVDHAEGPPGHQAAFIWHAAGIEKEVQDQRILLRSGENPIEMIMFHLGPGELQIEKENEQSSESLIQVLVEGHALTISLNDRKIVVHLGHEGNSQ